MVDSCHKALFDTGCWLGSGVCLHVMTIYSPTDVVVVAEWFQSPTHPPLIYYSSNRRHSHHSDEQTVACVVYTQRRLKRQKEEVGLEEQA